MVTKIQRWQCAAFARILEERIKKIENSSYWDDPKRKRERERLEEKYHLEGLEAVKDKTHEEYHETEERIDKEMRKFDEEAEGRRAKKIQALTLAVRDIWTCESVEEAKRIIEKAVSEE